MKHADYWIIVSRLENDRRGYQEVWGIRIKEARINEVWLYWYKAEGKNVDDIFSISL